MFLANVVVIVIPISFAQSQTTITPESTTQISYGCIDSSSRVVQGNYTIYTYWNNHSIWIKEAISDAFVIYYDEHLGNIYKAFGLYRCDSKDTYIQQVENMQDKAPKGIMGCEGTPNLFCPTLDPTDATTLVDGMAASDDELNWIYMKDFYECTHWFVYDDTMNYPSTATVTFENTWCVSSNDGNTYEGNVITPGDKTHNGMDTHSKRKMSAGALTALWSIVGVFVLFCIAAIVYYIHKWRQNKLEIELKTASRVALTSQNEEMFTHTKPEKISTPLVDVVYEDPEVSV